MLVEHALQQVGVLDVDPELESPAPAAAVVCFRCRGSEVGCPLCWGTGGAAIDAQAAALRAAADRLAA